MAREIARMPSGAVRAPKALLRHGSHSTIDQVLYDEVPGLSKRFPDRDHYAVAVCRIMEELKQAEKQ